MACAPFAPEPVLRRLHRRDGRRTCSPNSASRNLDGRFHDGPRTPAGLTEGWPDGIAPGKMPGPRYPAARPGTQPDRPAAANMGAEWEPTHPPGISMRSLAGAPGLCPSDGPADAKLRKNVRRDSAGRARAFLVEVLLVTGAARGESPRPAAAERQPEFTVAEIAVARRGGERKGTYATVHAHNNAGIRAAVTAWVPRRARLCRSMRKPATLNTKRAWRRPGARTLSIMEQLVADLAPWAWLRAQRQPAPQPCSRVSARDVCWPSRSGGRAGRGLDSDLPRPGRSVTRPGALHRAQLASPIRRWNRPPGSMPRSSAFGDDPALSSQARLVDIVGFAGRPAEHPGSSLTRDRASPWSCSKAGTPSSPRLTQERTDAWNSNLLSSVTLPQDRLLRAGLGARRRGGLPSGHQAGGL